MKQLAEIWTPTRTPGSVCVTWIKEIQVTRPSGVFALERGERPVCASAMTSSQVICSGFVYILHYRTRKLYSVFIWVLQYYFKPFRAFRPEIVLVFTGRRRSSVDPDRALQEALRTRLRVVESNSQDVIQLFKVSDATQTVYMCPLSFLTT